MANRLRVTELDFDQIKTNLKSFLQQQSEFSDYDFEGSGLNVLLDVLAYNTHYNAYYLNMIANESFLDTASLRDSVVSHAKKLGYTPRSNKAPTATINVEIETNNSNTEIATIPAGYFFISNELDGVVYKFTTTSDTSVGKTGTKFVFTGLNVYEGEYLTYSYTQSNNSNPKQVFTIPDENVDTSTLKVVVQQSSSNTTSTVYNLAQDFITISSTEPVYYLQEGRDGMYQIYFGDDVVGKSIPDGSVVRMSYLRTKGPNANKCRDFIASAPILGYTNFTVNTTSVAAGGSLRETVDQIKYTAPLQYISQNRAVTIQDYIRLIQQKYPQFEAVNVWGGEDNVPPVYGKVFVAAKPRFGYTLTQTEKDYFLNKILKPMGMLTVTPEIIDVDYNYVKLETTVYYNPSKLAIPLNNFKTNLYNTISAFLANNLNSFNSYFKPSQLETLIDNTDASILSNNLEVFLSKRFRPSLVSSGSYTLDFGTEMERGTITDNFYSSPNFSIYDENLVSRTSFIEEIPSSFTGIETIQLINPGFNYTSTPTIEIVGDGSGATATATVVNGKIKTINIVTPGVGYTTAAVRILGGGGSSATAEALLENRYGQIRIAYFKPDAITNQNVKIVLKSFTNSGVIGSIDYVLGKVQINNFNPHDIGNDFKELSINMRPKRKVFQSKKEKLLTYDLTDESTIVINLVPIE